MLALSYAPRMLQAGAEDEIDALASQMDRHRIGRSTSSLSQLILCPTVFNRPMDLQIILKSLAVAEEAMAMGGMMALAKPCPGTPWQ